MATALFLRCPCSITITSGRSKIDNNGLSGSRPLLRKIVRENKKVAKQEELRCALQVDTVTNDVATTLPPKVEEYTVSYRHDGGSNADEGFVAVGKGWTDAEGNLDHRWVAKFRGLAVIAQDRVEMHTILANQRSNWNHLFHQTIVIVAVSAATAAAINGAEPGPGLTLLATSLNLICAAFMTLVNKQQPSQLAEEQRRAARFFKRVLKDIESTLEVDPAMREEASKYWEEKVGTLYTLDKSFPLPLSPGGLEKFPDSVVPAQLGPQPGADDLDDVDDHIPEASEFGRTQFMTGLGWTQKNEDYLKETMKRIRTKDIPHNIGLAEKAKRLNLAVTRVSPFLAIAGALGSIANGLPALHFSQISWLAAAFTVGAVFTHSVSHALQLGSALELYRNYAGYYADIERAIERALHLPAHTREDWELFIKRINLKLGQNPDKEDVAQNDRTAVTMLEEHYVLIKFSLEKPA
ncbi:unnamed protein product [Calypogeia fissa]